MPNPFQRADRKSADPAPPSRSSAPNAAKLARKPSHRYDTTTSPTSTPSADSSALARKQSHRRPPPSASPASASSSAATDKTARGTKQPSSTREAKQLQAQALKEGKAGGVRRSAVSAGTAHREGMAQDRDNGKVTRQQSLRTFRASESERDDRRRRRNRESARRARDRDRSERETMERAYDANEVRIKHLEVMVDELSSELRRHNTISNFGGRARAGGAARERGDDDGSDDFDVGEDRPKWFGAAF